MPYCPNCRTEQQFSAYMQPWIEVTCAACSSSCFASEWLDDDGTKLGDPLGEILDLETRTRETKSKRPIRRFRPSKNQGRSLEYIKARNNMASATHHGYKNHDHRSFLKIFLCHASDDKLRVKDLYTRLKKDGYIPWLDEVDLIPGQNWEQEIQKAVRQSHIVAVCLSNRSITKEGYVQKEIKCALDVADEKPEGIIFIIPIRLEACALPTRLEHLQCVDLFKKGSYKMLLNALNVRSADVART